MDWFAPAFSLWGTATTWLEVVAFVLSLAMVGCNIREIHWGWPLAAMSSLLYFALFWQNKLYGDASLQIFFAVVSLWGWMQWLRGGPARVHLSIGRMTAPQRWGAAIGAALLWPATGWFLKSYTDTDVPWWDAFPTALSVIGQVLLGRKFIENWWVWLGVNVVSVALFAYKGLWLTAILYTLFAALSVVGWRAWHARRTASNWGQIPITTS